MLENRLLKKIALFLKKLMANSKKSDSIKPPHSPPWKGGDIEGVKKAEQKFLRELKSIRVDIKKLHESYDAALTKRRLAAAKKSLDY